MHDFRPLLDESDEELLGRLADIQSEIANLHEEIAMVESDEVRQKAAALTSSGEASSSARRDRVNMTVVEPVATRITLCANREALVEEKWLIVRVLNARGISGNSD